jgi:cytochrome c-type biogenesis protein CcmH
MLWTILTLMTVLAAVGLAVPLVRRADAARTARQDTVSVLKAQLGEIEAQAAAGALSETEAEGLKSDLKRRLLAEGRQGEPLRRPTPERVRVGLAFGLGAVIALVGAGLYLKIGHPQERAAPATPQSVQAGADHPQGDVATMIAQLEQQLQAQPANAEGWRMLGWSYMQVGRDADAAKAYGRAVALDPHNGEYLSAQGEATLRAAGGDVTGEAQALFQRALAVDPQDPRARYFLAMAKDQRGDHAGAMADWIALIKSAPPDAPWVSDVRGFVEKIAVERGVDLKGQLPPAAAAPASGPEPGPTADQVAAAQQMSDADRQQMIEGMVSRLEGELKANPKDRAGWERLMRARMVMGQPQLATAALRDGVKALAGASSEQAGLKQAAKGLGVPGA